jgi:carbon storage regulator
MLILTRRKNESIIIGDDIEITITQIFDNKVRLGIAAPRKITIFRKEIHIQIQQNKATHANSHIE